MLKPLLIVACIGIVAIVQSISFNSSNNDLAQVCPNRRVVTTPTTTAASGCANCSGGITVKQEVMIPGDGSAPVASPTTVTPTPSGGGGGGCPFRR